MNCKYCGHRCQKAGKQPSGVQKYHCTGCGIRSISRLLLISATTVLAIIRREAAIVKPPENLPVGSDYETDALNIYPTLIPSTIHRCKKQQINHIERKNLTFRTHLKRLSRRSICFSRKMDVLEACVRLYCWR